MRIIARISRTQSIEVPESNDCKCNLPFYMFFVVDIFLHEPLIVSLQVLNTDLQLLVNPQPGVVHFPQGGRLLGEILPTYQTVGHDELVKIETDGLFVSFLKIRPFGQIFDGIHYASNGVIRYSDAM